MSVTVTKREPLSESSGQMENMPTPERDVNRLPQGSSSEGVYKLLPWQMIDVSELNPRKNFDTETLDDLAASIQEHGLIQPITVRPGPSGMGYVIVAGERRFRACRSLGWVQIPAIVRSDIDEKKHLELALIENLERKDLDAIEVARAYKALQGLGYKHADIARVSSRKETTVTNTLRLLQLPAEVQDLIRAGQLSGTHGKALLKWADFPDVLTAMAHSVMEHDLNVRMIEQGLTQAVWADLKNAKRVVEVPPYSMPFDFHKNCNQCPLSAYYKPSATYYGFCLRPDHYQELVDAVLAQRAQEAALMAKAKASGNTKVQAALAQGAKLPATETDAMDLTCGTGRAPVVAAKDMIQIRSLSYEQFEYITGEVPGCSEDCDCRVIALNHSNSPVPICLNKARYNGLKAAATRIATKTRKVVFEERLDAVLCTMPKEPDLRSLALLVRMAVHSVTVEVRRKVASRFVEHPKLQELAAKPPYQVSDTEFQEALAKLSVAELVNFGVEMILRQEMAHQLEYKSDRLPILDWWTGKTAEISPVFADEDQDDEDGEEDLDEKKASEISTFLDMCSDLKTPPPCIRCGDPIPLDALGVPVEAIRPTGAVELESGVMLIDRGGYPIIYCGKCAPGVVMCEGCGCTHESPCEGVCSWIAFAWCSSCEAKLAREVAGV